MKRILIGCVLGCVVGIVVAVVTVALIHPGVGGAFLIGLLCGGVFTNIGIAIGMMTE